VTVASAAGLSDRHLPLSGTFNVRDVGGYPADGHRTTRWRTLFRSDALSRLEDDGRAVLESIGVRTIIDLREGEELTSAPNLLGDWRPRTLHRPLFDRKSTGIVATTDALRSLQETYFLVVDERPRALVAAVRELTGDGVLPAIVHCTAGKDRTGMVIALTLAALEVADGVIASDFAATGPLLRGAFRDQIKARTAATGLPTERLEGLLSADPVLILSFLKRIRDAHGDVPAFLVKHGMTDRELAILRERLLTDAAAATAHNPPEVAHEPAGGGPATGGTDNERTTGHD
jgi:protein-tyrosine phosphatase